MSPIARSLMGLALGASVVAPSLIVAGSMGSAGAALVPGTARVPHSRQLAPGSARLIVKIRGLPAGNRTSLLAPVTVDGPGKYGQALFASKRLSGLKPGRYVIQAKTVNTDKGPATPSQPRQVVRLNAAGTKTARVSYAVGDGDLSGVVRGSLNRNVDDTAIKVEWTLTVHQQWNNKGSWEDAGSTVTYEKSEETVGQPGLECPQGTETTRTTFAGAPFMGMTGFWLKQDVTSYWHTSGRTSPIYGDDGSVTCVPDDLSSTQSESIGGGWTEGSWNSDRSVLTIRLTDTDGAEVRGELRTDQGPAPIGPPFR